MSFASLKKQSNLGSLTAKLVKEVEKVNNSSGGGDERLWKPELDKSGNGLLLSDSYQHQIRKKFHGQSYTHMPFKSLVVGILKTL